MHRMNIANAPNAHCERGIANGHPERTERHIDIQHHFVRENQAAGEVDLRYVSTAGQLADGLTKALPGEAFRRFWIVLGLEE